MRSPRELDKEVDQYVFYLTIGCIAVFIISILLMVAMFIINILAAISITGGV